MITSLKMTNVGPAPEMKLDFGTRLNLLTGDNGLGKSFLLDIVWWALTRKWPAEINLGLTAGRKALPSNPKKTAEIAFSFFAKKKRIAHKSAFSPKEQAWPVTLGRPANPGLVLYAMADGSFAVWDPHRNYWRARAGRDVPEHIPAFVFHPGNVWDGLQNENGVWLCNGLIRDWAGWQKEKGSTFDVLKAVLKFLSPFGNETLEPGSLARISPYDSRDIPTIRMPYNQDVPVVHASAGMRRIMALSYFLVWAWEEHNKAAEQMGDPPTNQVTFLIDEIESHLHPNWQRRIVPALLFVMNAFMNALTGKAAVQLITATHSPIVMASVEPLFDASADAWFDLDYEAQSVALTRRDFEKHGTVGGWLTSNAFDQTSDRAIEYERLLNEASSLLKEEKPSKKKLSEMYRKLCNALNPRDAFLFRWLAICEKKGWRP